MKHRPSIAVPDRAVREGGPAARTPARRLGLHVHLAGLVLAVPLPALAFGAAASWFALRIYGTAQEARLVDIARALALTVGSQISAQVAALRVLAALPDLEESGSFADFDILARVTAEVFRSWVVLYDRDAGQLLNTRLPLGARLPGSGGGIGPGGGGRWVAEALRTGQPVVTDLATGRVSGRPTAFVFVPILREGRAPRVLGLALLPERLPALLSGQAASGAGTISLTDGRGALAARSRNAERLVGQSRPKRTDLEPRAASGVISGHDLERGVPIRIAYEPVPGVPGWTLWVNEPESTRGAAGAGAGLAPWRGLCPPPRPAADHRARPARAAPGRRAGAARRGGGAGRQGGRGPSPPQTSPRSPSSRRCARPASGPRPRSAGARRDCGMRRKPAASAPGTGISAPATSTGRTPATASTVPIRRRGSRPRSGATAPNPRTCPASRNGSRPCSPPGRSPGRPSSASDASPTASSAGCSAVAK